MDTLDQIKTEIAACTLCKLCKRRKQPVFGAGNLTPEIVFIGEAPGREEDKVGIPFVGRAGKLLDKLLEKLDVKREDVWVGNVCKCRPPENRTPEDSEMSKCSPYLKRQLAIIKPKVIICLGTTAVRGLVGLNGGITRMRGTWKEYEGIKVMPTYHPAYILRNKNMLPDLFNDVKLAFDEVKKDREAKSWMTVFSK